MGESKRLIINMGVLAIGGMATKVASFLLLPLYTAVLSTAEYGIVDYVNTVALFCVPAVSLLMDEAVFRFLIDCESDVDKSKVITAACTVAFVGCLIFTTGALVVWFLFRPKNLAWVVGIVVSGALLQMAGSILRGFGKTSSYALLNFSAGFGTIALNVVFISVFRWGVVGMLSAYVIAQGSVSAVFIVAQRMWRYLDLSTMDWDCVKRLMRYSAPLIPNRVSWNIMNMVGRFIVMGSLGADALGVYAVASKFPGLMDTVYGFFYQSWKESSARVLGSEENEETFYNGVYGVLRRFMMGVVLVMTGCMPAVYHVLVVGSYDDGLLYIPILLLATYFSNISGFYGGIFTAYRDTGIMGTTTVVSAIICLALSFVLIPTIGLYGACLATLASTFVANEYRRIKVATHATLNENRSEQAIVVISVVMTFALYYAGVYTGSTTALVICAAVSITFFLIMNCDLVGRVLRALRGKVCRHAD